MTIFTASKSQVSIGPSQATTPANAAAYAALTFTKVSQTESIGEFGDSANPVNFTSLDDGRVEKTKGANDAGTMAIVAAKLATDAGQLALKAANATAFNYPFKVELNDKASSGGTNTIYYFMGLVMSARDNIGGNENVVRTTFNVGINTNIIEIPAT